MNNNEPQIIKTKIMEIYQGIQHLSDGDLLKEAQAHDVAPCFQELHRILALDIAAPVVDNLSTDKALDPILKRIAHLKTMHGLGMEIRRSRALAASAEPWEFLKGFLFYPNYIQLAGMEYKGGKLRRGDRVVFIGSGPMPLSLICLYSQYGVKGMGIERNAAYAQLSEKVIDALGLGDHIRIVRGDHLSLPLKEECALVMIGADAVPKDEIFSHLAQVLPPGTKLSYRIYERGLRGLFDENPVGNLPKQLVEYDRIRPEPPVNNTCIFLSKKTR